MRNGTFWIDCDGMRLSAVLEGWDGSPRPIAIIVHGFTGNKSERHIVAVARAFNDLGVATLRADMYGHGQSDGAFRDHTLYKWLTDGMALVDWARALEGVTDLYLCGHSQGGLLVMLLAALEQDRVAGLIPMSPAAMIPEMARKGELLGQTFAPDHLPEALGVWDHGLLGSNYARVAQAIDVEAAIDRYKGPVLVIHGDQDESVPVQVGIDAARRYARGELVIIPGDTHCYDCHLERVTAAVTNWMEPRVHG